MRKTEPNYAAGLMAMILEIIFILAGFSGSVQAGLVLQHNGASYGFFGESYLEAKGTHSQGRLCPLNDDGTINEADCSWFRVDISKAIDKAQLHSFGAYGNYVFFERGQPYLRQSLYDANGVDSWYRSCPIVGERVDWSQCENRWQYFDVTSVGFGPLKAYGSFTYDVGWQKYLVQHLIGVDNQIMGRTCPTRSDGKVDWGACHEWHRVQDIPGLYGKRFSSYGAYTYNQGDQTFLRQVLIEDSGQVEWDRTCELEDGMLTAFTMWGIVSVEPEYSLDVHCGCGWLRRDLGKGDWVPDEKGKKPQAFAGYDAFYVSRKEMVQRQLKEMIKAELEGYGVGTTGGLGGDILIVTSSADSGEGTLRWALDRAASTPGPHIIVFAFDGTIALGSPLRVPSNTTIEGRGRNKVNIPSKTLAEDRSHYLFCSGERRRPLRSSFLRNREPFWRGPTLFCKGYEFVFAEYVMRGSQGIIPRRLRALRRNEGGSLFPDC